MSAFLVSTNHIDTLIALARADRRTFAIADDEKHARDLGVVDTVCTVGQRLIAANVKNLNHLYAARHGAIEIPTYHYRAPSGSLPTAVEGIKLVQSFEYQCCDIDDYAESWVKKFCDRLIVSLIARLPGYDAAPWGI